MNIKLKEMVPYLIITLLFFCIIPIFIKDTGSGMVVLLLLNPLLVLVISTLYSKKEEFNIVFCILQSVLFIITILTILNLSALIYLIYYFIVSVIGSFIGNAIRKYQNRIK